MFAGLANVVTKHSKAVIVVWIVIVLCALPLGLQSDSKLEYEMTKMVGTSSEAAQGNAIIEKEFSHSIGMDEVVVIQFNTDTDGSTTNEDAAATLASAINEKLHSYYGKDSSGNYKVSASSVGVYHKDTSKYSVMLVSIKSTDDNFAYSTETGNIRNLVSQAKTASGVNDTTYVTGNAALTYDTMTSSNSDIKLIDVISIVLIFVLLALFFGALVTAVVPPIGFGVAFALALLAIYAIGSVTGVYYLSKTLVTVTMLGAGCDYGIFIITRYREERKKGAEHHDALTTSIQWAGESVFTSGMSVIIGFACLAICDFQLVRSMGIVLAAGIVFALISALTLVPAIVNLLGEKVFWPNTFAKYKGVEDGTNTGLYAKGSKLFGRYFKWVARVTRRYSIPIVAVAVLISVPTIAVYATSHSSYDMISVEPNGEAKEGFNAIMDETYGGTLMPTNVVLELNASVTEKMGSVALSGNTVGYIQWSSVGLTQNADGSYTGYVPAIMSISSDIEEKYSSIVAQATGLNSWQVLFALGQATAYALLCDYDYVHALLFEKYYESSYDTVLAQIKALYPTYTEEQQVAMAVAKTTEISTAYADANTPKDAAGLKAFADAHINDAETVNKINEALVEAMPSAVQSYVATYVAAATAYAEKSGQTAVPTIVLAADGTTAVTLANLIDYVINVGTGLLSDKGTAATIMIITNERPMSDNTMTFVSDIKNAFHGTNGFDSQYSSMIKSSYVAGQNAVMYDVSNTVTSQFTIIQIVVIILLLALLFFILGCYLTPIRAMICIMLSVIWTLALTFVVFQNIMGTPVCWIVPIVLFVVLLGLGMDYDIFITTRVRENRVRGMSNHDAIDNAICSASGVISLCALIMGGTFLTLLLGSSSMLWEFGFALGVGILIDGLFMVTFVGPALMHIMGDWSWKGPAFLQRHRNAEMRYNDALNAQAEAQAGLSTDDQTGKI